MEAFIVMYSCATICYLPMFVNDGRFIASGCTSFIFVVKTQ